MKLSMRPGDSHAFQVDRNSGFWEMRMTLSGWSMTTRLTFLVGSIRALIPYARHCMFSRQCLEEFTATSRRARGPILVSLRIQDSSQVVTTVKNAA